jgi:CheY-like chemotaxis protein
MVAGISAISLCAMPRADIIVTPVTKVKCRQTRRHLDTGGAASPLSIRNSLQARLTSDARHSSSADVRVCTRSRCPKVVPLSQPESPAGWQRTILVVDDEDIVRSLVARSLQDEGYRVLSACHGAAAIGLLEREGPGVDLVICDLVMPVLGGREVSDWMKMHCPGVPLLFVSGYPRAYLEAHHLYDPTAPLLRKPFLPSRLLEAVGELLKGGPDGEQRRAEGV